MLGRVAILAIGLAALAALAAACTNADEPGPAPLTGSADPGGTTEVPVEALPAKLPEPYIILGDGSADEEARTEILYTVQPGDSLANIADRFEVTAAELQRINGIADPSVLRAGDELRIPVREGALSERIAATLDNDEPVEDLGPPPGEEYVIQPGDTLFEIGLRFGIDWTELQRYNRLTEFEANTLTPGTVIIIPPLDDEEDAEEQAQAEPPG